MPTLDELLDDLTPVQRNALTRVGNARVNMDAAMQGYFKAIDDAVALKVSYRMIERETGVTAPAIYRTRQRWLKSKTR